MQKKEPIILITNDDGITAPGIKALVDAVRGLGRIVVVAPDSPQSGMGHAITIGHPLRLNKVDVFDGIDAWQCSGTPADCVKLARDKVLHEKPDICLSGINHGPNHSINVIYSGTMSAAMEAAIEDIPSAGISLFNFDFDADFSIAAQVARNVAERMLTQPLPPHILLNVNVPNATQGDFKGVKICRQAYARWQEQFDHRTDPRGKDYYWMVGKFLNLDKGTGTDVEALKDGYASIVPVTIDLTDVKTKEWLEAEWKF
ncbi:5'/3'-nucleotidase SurE [Nemorincola caseinilytica]|uniref:5'-nucleotidase SurE n=1 Tax=Nemorincola caseinilytica TaxID=2054315 RepID=A0ABP8N9N6_9BACT